MSLFSAIVWYTLGLALAQGVLSLKCPEGQRNGFSHAFQRAHCCGSEGSQTHRGLCLEVGRLSCLSPVPFSIQEENGVRTGATLPVAPRPPCLMLDGGGRKRRLRCSCGVDCETDLPCMCAEAAGRGGREGQWVFASSVEAWLQPLFPAMDNSVPSKAVPMAGWQRLPPPARRWADTPPAGQERWHITAMRHLDR